MKDKIIKTMREHLLNINNLLLSKDSIGNDNSRDQNIYLFDIYESLGYKNMEKVVPELFNEIKKHQSEDGFIHPYKNLDFIDRENYPYITMDDEIAYRVTLLDRVLNSL